MLFPLTTVYAKQHHLDGIIIFIGVNDLSGSQSQSQSRSQSLTQSQSLVAEGSDVITATTAVSHILENVDSVIKESLKRIPNNNILLVSPCNINPRNLSKFALNHGYGSSGCLSGLKTLEVEYEKLAQKRNIHFLSLLHVVSPECYIDGVHLSKSGYEQIATAISDKIQQSKIFIT
jgi:lysophospholipase L1-like esterase